MAQGATHPHGATGGWRHPPRAGRQTDHGQGDTTDDDHTRDDDTRDDDIRDDDIMTTQKQAMTPEGTARPRSGGARPPRSTPLTTITPMRPGWTTFARAVLDVLPHTPWGASTELEQLAFIHSARWAIVRDLWVDGRRHRPRYDYLLFESNFDGPFGAYVEAFADVLGLRMRLVWNSSFGFPNHPADERLPLPRRLRRPIPGRAFVDYVRRCDLGADHYYCAVDASTRQILEGLIALDGLRDGVDTATILARMRGPAVPARQPSRCADDRRGDHVALTTLAPIVPGAEPSLRAALADLRSRGASASPFHAVPGLHHARWVVVDELPALPGAARDAWPRAYLLMTATLDAGALPVTAAGPDPAEHLSRHLGEAARDVHEHCEGVGGDLVAWLGRHRIGSQRFYSGYPFVDRAGVGAALDARALLLLRAAQDADEHRS